MANLPDCAVQAGVECGMGNTVNYLKTDGIAQRDNFGVADIAGFIKEFHFISGFKAENAA
jgi:hypothetical protein